MNDVTHILCEMQNGSPHAAEELLPLVYNELRRLAHRKMAAERVDHTGQATGLVHEAYIRLVDVETPPHWNGRGHFYAAAAEAMRRILIESARRRSAVKRGGEIKRVPLDDVRASEDESSGQALAVDSALSRLADHDPVKAKLVELRYFGGLTIAEAAEAMQISTATANRHWAYARAWLQTEIRSGSDSVIA